MLRYSILLLSTIITATTTTTTVCSAFTAAAATSRRRPTTAVIVSRASSSSSSALFLSGSDDQQASSSSSSSNPAGELTSTLARLDQQWKIQQSSQPRSRWTKLVLSKSNNDDEDDVKEEAPESFVSSIIEEDFVYLLEPPNNSLPSCLIVFTGGAGLGTYPQIAYNELLLRISNRLNAAVITAPYAVGLDHFALAKQTGELTRRAIIHCQDDASRLYPPNLPTYTLSHSLGSKLTCIYVAATNQDYDGVGFMSFNNFSFGKTIGMAKQFAETIRQNIGVGGDIGMEGVANDALDGLFNFAELAVSATGIDFSPSATEMERLIEMKYSSELAEKTRLFTFDEDTLENTQDFLNACCAGSSSSSSSIHPQVSGLPGTHLTPVYFSLGLNEMDLPEEAREMASEAMGGFQSASFGNEEELDVLVDEVCEWIKGKEPSRKPAWLRERPRLAAEASDNS